MSPAVKTALVLVVAPLALILALGNTGQDGIAWALSILWLLALSVFALVRVARWAWKGD